MRMFIPASNQKILVTATAISLFGPQHRFETRVGLMGESLGSFVDGDIVVCGSGDPTLSDRYWTSGSEAMRAIADSLHDRGIRHVGGSLVVDVAAWDSATVGSMGSRRLARGLRVYGRCICHRRGRNRADR